MTAIQSHVDGQLVEGEYKHIKTERPRFSWLPRFLMRWPRFVIEGESHFYQLNETPPAGTLVTVMYETTWGTPDENSNQKPVASLTGFKD